MLSSQQITGLAKDIVREMKKLSNHTETIEDKPDKEIKSEKGLTPSWQILCHTFGLIIIFLAWIVQNKYKIDSDSKVKKMEECRMDYFRYNSDLINLETQVMLNRDNYNKSLDTTTMDVLIHSMDSYCSACLELECILNIATIEESEYHPFLKKINEERLQRDIITRDSDVLAMNDKFMAAHDIQINIIPELRKKVSGVHVELKRWNKITNNWFVLFYVLGSILLLIAHIGKIIPELRANTIQKT